MAKNVKNAAARKATLSQVVAVEASKANGVRFGVAYGADCPYKEGDVIKVQFSHIGAIQASNSRLSSFGNPLADWQAVYTGEDKDGNPTWDKVTPKEQADGLSRFLRAGFKSEKPVTGYYIGDNPIAQEKVRQERVRVAKEYRDQGLTAIADAYEQAYMGQPIDFVVEDGNRRMRAIHGVTAWRIAQGMPSPFDYEVTLCVKPMPESEQARLLSGLEANTDMGKKSLTSEDRLALVYSLLCENPGLSQADLINRGVKKGEAQRCFHLAKLARNFPKLNLITRLCFTPQPGAKDVKGGPGCFIPLSKLDHMAATRLAKGFKPGTKDDNEDNRIEGGLTDKGLENFFQTLAKGEANVKRYQINDLVEGMESHPSLLLQDWAQAIKDGNGASFLAKLVPLATALDVATDYAPETVDPPSVEEVVAE